MKREMPSWWQALIILTFALVSWPFRWVWSIYDEARARKRAKEKNDG